MNLNKELLEKKEQEIKELKNILGFIHHKPSSSQESADIDLMRLASLVDPTTSAKLYSNRKYTGPLLTWIRVVILRALYFIFKFDFARVIELHQNVWVMAYQLKELQERVRILEENHNSKSSHSHG